MYTLIRTATTRTLFTAQVPSMVGAVITPELFYKFHSFALECLTFLATWFVLDAALSWLVKRWPAEKTANGV
jgi:hypothetical protein